MSTPRGKQAFEDYYKSLFGESEAALFFESLQKRFPPIALFAEHHRTALQHRWEEAGLSWRTLDWYTNAALWPPEVPLDTILPGYDERLFYVMSPSSLLAPLALQPQEGDMVLDACAAPGGKTLLLSQLMNESDTLIANDLSSQRRRRLKEVLQEYKRPQVQVWGKKAEIIFKTHPNVFDRILVDAPCSSEKHVYNSPFHLAQWSMNRIKQLKLRQIALLSGLFLALKPGGRMVYSTCAVTPEENEGVIATLLKKKKGAAQLVPIEQALKITLPGGNGIDNGQLTAEELLCITRILPHRDHMDPQCIAIIEKTRN